MKKKTYNKRNKFGPKICDNRTTFHECELAILRQAVDDSDRIQRQSQAQSEEISEIINIL